MDNKENRNHSIEKYVIPLFLAVITALLSVIGIGMRDAWENTNENVKNINTTLAKLSKITTRVDEKTTTLQSIVKENTDRSIKNSNRIVVLETKIR